MNNQRQVGAFCHTVRSPIVTLYEGARLEYAPINNNCHTGLVSCDQKKKNMMHWQSGMYIKAVLAALKAGSEREINLV